MKNRILFIALFLILAMAVQAQQNFYGWRIGVHGGAMTYHGDLSTDRILDPQLSLINFTDNIENYISYGLSVEKSLSKAWGLRLMGARGVFEANDRTIDWDKNLYTDNENFSRALNVRTELQDASILFVYNFDNGEILSDEAFFSPYLLIGAGVTQFEAYGDLYGENGEQYFYWSDNTIRNQAEGTDNATEVIQDGNYETKLAPLDTEGVEYSKNILNFPVGLGLKFRLGDRFNLNLEAMAKYTNTDYLDDVSGNYPESYFSTTQEYASNPSGISREMRGSDSDLNDIYGYVNLSLNYNFGFKQTAFIAPVLYSKYGNKKEVIMAPKEERNSLLNEQEFVQPNQPTREIQIIEKEPEVIYREKETIIYINEKGDTIRRKTKMTESSEPQGSIEEIEQLEDRVQIEIEPTEKDDIIIKEKIILDKTENLSYKESGSLPEEGATTDTLGSVSSVEAEPLSLEPLPELESIETEVTLLKEVQEDRREIVELSNEMAELQTKEDINREELDAMKQKMEILEKRLNEYENFNNNVAVRANEDYSKPENKALRAKTARLEAELETLRAKWYRAQAEEEKLDAQRYKKMAQENEQRIRELEKEFLETQKQLAKGTYQKEVVIKTVPVEVPVEKSENQSPSTTASPKLEEENSDFNYDKEIDALKKEIAKTNQRQNARDEKRWEEMTDKLATLEKKLDNINQPAGQTSTIIKSDPADKREIENLKRTVQQLQRELAETKKIKPAPSTTTVITQPATTTRSSTISPAPPVRTTTPVYTSAAETAIRGYEVSRIFFEKGSAVISVTHHARLNQLANILMQYPEVSGELQGFTDKSGDSNANLALSGKRAEAVKQYLISRGIRNNQLRTISLGETMANSEDDPFSRRVEVKLLIYK